MKKNETVTQRETCVFSKRSPLCHTMEKAGVPPDTKWWTLVLYMRSLEYMDSLSLKQRAEIQALLIDLLKEKDFSDASYRKLVEDQDRIISSPYRQRLKRALEESAALVQDFQTLLLNRAGDVKDLGEVAVETIEEKIPPDEAVKKLRGEFHKLVEVMERDTEKLEHLARTDPLTQLNNRGAFDEYMDQKQAETLENGQALCLLMLDIDHFKRVNDTYGHMIGDQALKTVAGKILTSLKESAPGEHFPARYGGEEFAVVLPGASLEAAMETAENIRQRIERYNFMVRTANGDILHKGVKFTISIGVARSDPQWKDKLVDKLVEAADAALYDAKSKGRNRVGVYTAPPTRKDAKG